jgi:hypothetical protein
MHGEHYSGEKSLFFLENKNPITWSSSPHASRYRRSYVGSTGLEMSQAYCHVDDSVGNSIFSFQGVFESSSQLLNGLPWQYETDVDKGSVLSTWRSIFVYQRAKLV